MKEAYNFCLMKYRKIAVCNYQENKFSCSDLYEATLFSDRDSRNKKQWLDLHAKADQPLHIRAPDDHN